MCTGVHYPLHLNKKLKNESQLSEHSFFFFFFGCGGGG